MYLPLSQLHQTLTSISILFPSPSSCTFHNDDRVCTQALLSHVCETMYNVHSYVHTSAHMYVS